MNSYSRLLELNVERLDHWPNGQLQKATDGSIGYDLKVADTIIVPSLETLDKTGQYSWLPRLPLSEFTEGQQTDILGVATRDPLGQAVLDKDEKVLLGASTTTEAAPYKRYSFYVNEQGVVHCKKYRPFLVRTGLKLSPSDRCWFSLTIRSGIATKFHINLINGIGVVDADYPDEYLLALHALHDDQIILKGERIAQLIVNPFIPAQIKHNDRDNNLMFVYGDEYGGPISPVRMGGFGSTGM